MNWLIKLMNKQTNERTNWLIKLMNKLVNMWMNKSKNEQINENITK